MLVKHRNRGVRSAAIILVAIGALRIVFTWTIFSEGIDEPIHLASGIEMLTRHQYRLHVVNPPLPRLAFALGPWLDGRELDGIGLGLDGKLGPYSGDFGIEGSDPEMELSSFGAASAIILSRREPGESTRQRIG